jgi:hypothetical protein
VCLKDVNASLMRYSGLPDATRLQVDFEQYLAKDPRPTTSLNSAAGTVTIRKASRTTDMRLT